MIKGIRKTFIENIDTLTWMDVKTKKAAKDKVMAFHVLLFRRFCTET